jgi:hypothetical protein
MVVEGTRDKENDFCFTVPQHPLYLKKINFNKKSCLGCHIRDNFFIKINFFT